MRRHPLLLLLLAAAVLGAAAVAAREGDARARRCVRVGAVDAYLRAVVRGPCRGRLHTDAPLFRRDRLRTTATGRISFHTWHIDRCDVYARSRVVVFPRRGVALRQEAGTTWCEQRAGRTSAFLAVGAKIGVRGTIFGLRSTRRGSVIKVARGSVVVSSPSRPAQRRTVRAGFQVGVAAGRPPAQPRPLDATPADARAIAALENDVVATAPEELERIVARLNANYVALVYEEGAATQARVLSRRLRGAKPLFFDRSRVLASPVAFADQLRRLKVPLVLVVGRFDEMMLVFETLRDELGRTVELVFVRAP